MNGEPPDGRPLGLRDLADEDSPDVVRVALRRFRRRTALRAMWLAGIVLAVLLLLPVFSTERSLPERYYDSPGASVGLTARSGPVRVVLVDGRRLDPGAGALHFVATTSEAGGQLTFLEFVVGGSVTRIRPDPYVPGVAAGPSTEAFVSFSLEDGMPESVVVSIVDVRSGTPPEPIEVTFDLSELTGLHEVWR